LTESQRSALKGFTTHHKIKPLNNAKFDSERFLNAVKQNALEKFQPQTKARIVLRAKVKKLLTTVEAQTIVETRTFQSKITEIVLDSTNQKISCDLKCVNRFLKTWQHFRGTGQARHFTRSWDLTFTR